jgi:hypothetical protein
MVVMAHRAAHSGHLDNEIMALTLQLAEINYRKEIKKVKYPFNNIRDLKVANSNYLSEVEAHLASLKDIKLAYSIANAIDTDAQVIADITLQIQQEHDDHHITVQMSFNSPDMEAPPPYTQKVCNDFIEDEIVQRLATILITNDDFHDDPHTEAGPSVLYQSQAVALDKLAGEAFECAGCFGDFRWAYITQLACGHAFCEPCLRGFIMAPVINRDLVLVPPWCCGTSVPFGTIVCALTEAEFNSLQHAEMEKATKDKTYCSNPECGRFIAPVDILAAEATCARYETKTYAFCNNAGHGGDCSDVPDIQATLELGAESKWQRCFLCRSLIEIECGCNHMTQAFKDVFLTKADIVQL